MSRWPGQRIGGVVGAGQHTQNRITGKPGSLTGNVERPASKRGRDAQHAAALVAQRLEAGKIIGGMHGRQFASAGWCCIADIQLFHQSGHVHQIAHPAFGLRAFGMTACRHGLNPVTHRGRQCRLAGGVPETGFGHIEGSVAHGRLLRAGRRCQCRQAVLPSRAEFCRR